MFTHDSMTGANMKLVTVNVKLYEDDPEPEQHLDQASSSNATRHSID